MFTLHTHFCTFGTDLYAQLVPINKISASELRRKFIKSALLVGYLQRTQKNKGLLTFQLVLLNTLTSRVPFGFRRAILPRLGRLETRKAAQILQDKINVGTLCARPTRRARNQANHVPLLGYILHSARTVPEHLVMCQVAIAVLATC